MRISIVVKVAIQNGRGQLLIMRRSDEDDNRPGGADLPGGGVDENESYAAAAAREVLEEAGLRIPENDLRLVYAYTAIAPEKGAAITRLMYTVRTTDEEVQLSHEHTDYWWRDPAAALQDMAGSSWQVPLEFMLKHMLTD